MPARKFKNSTYIPALNALAALITWLKPGMLSFRFGQLKSAIEPVAVRIEKEHQGMIDEHVLFDVEQPKDEHDKRTPDELPRKRRIRIGDTGLPEFDFGQKAATFREKYRELIEGETEITFTRLITEDDINRIEKERRETKPKGPDGQVVELPPVDFSALMPFMEESKAEAAARAERQAAEDRDFVEERP